MNMAKNISIYFERAGAEDDKAKKYEWHYSAEQTVEVFLKKMAKLIDQGKIDPKSIMECDVNECLRWHEPVVGVKQECGYVRLVHGRSQDEVLRGAIPFAIAKKKDRPKRRQQ